MAPLPETKTGSGAASAALMVNPHVAALPPYNAGMSVARARALSGHDDLARLASNENPDGCSPAVLAALAGVDFEPWRYADPACTALREALYPDERVAVVQAGVALEALQSAAIAPGLEPGIDLAARGTATIGGMVSTNAGGIMAHRYGVMHVRYANLRTLGGSFSAEHGVGAKRIAAVVATSDPVKLATMMRIKQALHPDQTLNPGKVLPSQPLARERFQ
jgi:FAD/FMN-containing dehydrogenase